MPSHYDTLNADTVRLEDFDQSGCVNTLADTQRFHIRPMPLFEDDRFLKCLVWVEHQVEIWFKSLSP